MARLRSTWSPDEMSDSASKVSAASPTARATGIRFPLFYGWVLVAVAFVTMAVGVNARTAFSLLFPAILAEFGWDRAVTAGAFSSAFSSRRSSRRLSGG